MQKQLLSRLLSGGLFLAATALFTAQSNVKVTYYPGNNQVFAVATDGKLYFSGDNLMIQPNASATPTSIPVSIIQKITLESYLKTNEVGANAAGLEFFPNPVTEYFTISGLKTKAPYKIYAMTGQLAQSGVYVPNSREDVHALAAGTYLIQINGVTFKFIKP